MSDEQNVVPGVGERIPQEQKRMTSGTGKTRQQVLAERRGLSEEAHHPGVRDALRHIAEVKAGTSRDLSGAALPGVQINAAILSAVSAAVEATHAFYRRVLGDEAFFTAYARWQRGEDGDTQGSGYLNSSGDAGGVLGGGSGREDEEDQTGDNQPAGDDTELLVSPEDIVSALRNDMAAGAGVGYITGQALALYGKGLDGLLADLGEGYVAQQAEQDGAPLDAYRITRSTINQPAGGQAGAGTPGGGQGKEAPPPSDPPPPHATEFPCPQCKAAGVDFKAGSEAGLKAHQRARHKDA